MTKKIATTATAAATAQVLDLQAILAEIDQAQVDMMKSSVDASFTERMTFEALQNPHNDSVQAKLKSYHKRMALPGILGLMVATKVDPSFINRSISEGKRFNIYAIDKLNDLLHGLNSGHMKNAVNIAVMKSLFRFKTAGVPFTGLAATAAVSDKVKVEKQIAALLVRHSVSAATAPTQTSSTMSALGVLGVVTNKGSQKFPIWELTEAPVTQRLNELLAA